MNSLLTIALCSVLISQAPVHGNNQFLSANAEDLVQQASFAATQSYVERVNDFTQKYEALPTDTNLEWYISYKQLCSKYADLDLPETVYDYYTNDEINLICRCVETECHGADFISKVNVANVIFNRIEDDRFPDNPRDVITATAPKQFAYGRKKFDEETILAVEYAFEIEDTTGGCLYFHSNSEKAKFNGAEFQFKDDVGHCFYR